MRWGVVVYKAGHRCGSLLLYEVVEVIGSLER